MSDIQRFLRDYLQESHTLREIINALVEKGLSEAEAKDEFKKFSCSTKKTGFDEHP